MKKNILFGLLFAMSTLAWSEGGQVGKIRTSPVFTADGSSPGVIINVPEGCEVAVTQSQVAIFCEVNND